MTEKNVHPSPAAPPSMNEHPQAHLPLPPSPKHTSTPSPTFHLFSCNLLLIKQQAAVCYLRHLATRYASALIKRVEMRDLATRTIGKTRLFFFGLSQSATTTWFTACPAIIHGLLSDEFNDLCGCNIIFIGVKG